MQYYFERFSKTAAAPCGNESWHESDVRALGWAWNIVNIVHGPCTASVGSHKSHPRVLCDTVCVTPICTFALYIPPCSFHRSVPHRRGPPTSIARGGDCHRTCVTRPTPAEGTSSRTRSKACNMPATCLQHAHHLSIFTVLTVRTVRIVLAVLTVRTKHACNSCRGNSK